MTFNKKNYPPNWDDLRRQVLERAHNRCEECGLMNQQIVMRKENNRPPTFQEWEWFKDYRREGFSFVQALKKLGFTIIVLTIAHLDNDPHNWDITIDRLRAWCQKCHLKYDQKIHIQNRKYGRNYRNKNLKFDL